MKTGRSASPPHCGHSFALRGAARGVRPTSYTLAEWNAGLLTEPVQDRGLAVVALDQLRQVRMKARRPHARTPRA
jgi:hypothetical protein